MSRRTNGIKTLPVSTARVTEVVHHKGTRRVNIVERSGKPRTLLLFTYNTHGSVKW